MLAGGVRADEAAGGGKIINIGSMMSIFGVSFSPAYGPSKGGLVQLTKSLATAWAKDNIQVNAVLPGWIDTELTRGARRQVTELHDNVLRRTPAGRWGTLEDMAGVAVFLASPASDFVTGTAIRWTAAAPFRLTTDHEPSGLDAKSPLVPFHRSAAAVRIR